MPSPLMTAADTTYATTHAQLAESAAAVEAWLDAWPGWNTLPDNLAQAARHGVLGGGKRLRPYLVRLATEACGGDAIDALPAAAAVELVHCFSLVHDDLPALDNDALRRGAPTVHVEHGEAMAILAGDLLLAQSFQVLASADWPDDVRARAVARLSQATCTMVVGQVHDTLGGVPEGLDPEATLILIHAAKTGALMQCALGLGADVAGADAATHDALQAYGEQIGIMFQIVDDLLDVTQSEAHVGKAVRKDADKGRPSWPDLLGIETAIEQVQVHRDAAITALAPLGDAGAALSELARALAVRTR